MFACGFASSGAGCGHGGIGYLGVTECSGFICRVSITAMAGVGGVARCRAGGRGDYRFVNVILFLNGLGGSAQFLVADRTINNLVIRALNLAGRINLVFFNSRAGGVLGLDGNRLFGSAQFLVASNAINDFIIRSFGLTGGVDFIFARGACGDAGADLRLGIGRILVRNRGCVPCG